MDSCIVHCCKLDLGTLEADQMVSWSDQCGQCDQCDQMLMVMWLLLEEDKGYCQCCHVMGWGEGRSKARYSSLWSLQAFGVVHKLFIINFRLFQMKEGIG